MTDSHIEVERRQQTGLIWLNRPEKRNALSADMWADLPRAADVAVRRLRRSGRSS